MASTVSGDQKVTGVLQVGNEANPPAISGGTGAMSTTNRQNSSIHLRSDVDTLPEVLHNSATEKFGFGQNAMEARLDDLVENSANTYITYAVRKMKITGVTRRYTDAPESAGGTVVVGITGDGNALLASGSETETGLTDDTLTAHTLTSTSADLLLDKGDKIVITITSNNADMTGGTGPMYYLEYEDN